MSRPQVDVYSISGDAKKATTTVALPNIFKAPIRPDIVQSVHTSMNKNKRQAYAVSAKAGHQTSATSWGTGRAVARIPRVSGSGTHRAGQAAFGNMCRGGRMFAPTKTWRRWHVKINTNERRYAAASAVAASGVPSLVLARGHQIEQIPQVPLVVEDGFESISKTKEAVIALKALGAGSDLLKVIKSRKIRAGKGKMRNRRHRQRKGPLVVFAEDKGITRALSNIPGVETCSVSSLNLLQLAPGGHMGRFVIWTQGAFAKLDTLWSSEMKRDYTLPNGIVSNADIARIINSSEVQRKLRPANAKRTKRPMTQKKNPLKNRQVMLRLNPYAQAFHKEGLGSQMVQKDARTKKDKFVKILHQD